jgi:hypothetical protein
MDEYEKLVASADIGLDLNEAKPPMLSSRIS